MVQENWQKDARKTIQDSMYRAMFVSTYRAFQMVSGLDFGRFSSTGYQARRLCGDFGLNRPLTKILISHFFTLFSILAWPYLQCFARVLDVYGLCGYKGMN